jgi:hypothetical protein
LKSAGKSLGIPVDFPENFKSVGNDFLVVKSAGKSLEIPANFPKNLKSAGNVSLLQNLQENPLEYLRIFFCSKFPKF